MAQRRYLSRRITESERIAKLHDDRARFIYSALITFTDREGRINAHPLALKTSTFEAFEYTAIEIADALDELADAGLIRLYGTPNHGLVGQYVRFHEFNTPHPNEPASDFAAEGPPLRAADALMQAVQDLIGVTPKANGKMPEALREAFGNTPEKSPHRREKKRGVERSREETSGEEEGPPDQAEDPTEDAPQLSAEERFEATVKTGINPAHQDNANREHLRRLIGAQNLKNKQVQQAWRRWYADYPRETIEAAWEAAKTSNHKAGSLYAFVDMLNGTRPLPKPRTNRSSSGIGDGYNFGE